MNPFLQGPYRPQNVIYSNAVVDVIDGALPTDLLGLYVRNGPNPCAPTRTPNQHWFEGDAMLHGVWLDGAPRAAKYANRYVHSEYHRINADYAAKHGTTFFYSLFIGLRGRHALLHFLVSVSIYAFMKRLPLPSGKGVVPLAVVYPRRGEHCPRRAQRATLRPLRNE
jgi:hypothetical protein